MSAFKALRDLSIGFEKYSKQVSAELFSAKISEPFEDVVARKVRDVKLFTSKLRFLEAKSLTIIPGKQQIEKTRSNDVIQDYEDTISTKIIEQLAVKSITQSHTIKNLLTTPSKELKPEFVEKKEKIIKELEKYRVNESELRSLEDLLEERENKLLEVQRRWDQVVGKLRDVPKVEHGEGQTDGPLSQRLQSLTDKVEVMRWLIAKLVTSRHDVGYDWSSDPHRRLRALAIARQRADVCE